MGTSAGVTQAEGQHRSWKRIILHIPPAVLIIFNAREVQSFLCLLDRGVEGLPKPLAQGRGGKDESLFELFSFPPALPILCVDVEVISTDGQMDLARA